MDIDAAAGVSHFKRQQFIPTALSQNDYNSGAKSEPHSHRSLNGTQEFFSAGSSESLQIEKSTCEAGFGSVNRTEIARPGGQGDSPAVHNQNVTVFR
jgi:hypothetical protein